MSEPHSDVAQRQAIHVFALQQMLDRGMTRHLHKLPEVSPGPRLLCVDPLAAKNINKIISHFQSVDGRNNAPASEAIDSVVQYILSSQLGGVRNVVKSGSQARGTMLGPHTDVDLIVYLRCLDHTTQDWWLSLPVVLLAYQQLLLLDERFVSVKASRTAVTFSVTSKCGGVVDVDLLLAPASLFNGLVKNLDAEVATMQRLIMRAPKEGRPYYSAACASLQVARAKPLFESAALTGLIRLVKRWIIVNRLSTAPGSYCLELVMLHCWRTVHATTGKKEEKRLTLNMFLKACARPKELFVDVLEHGQLPDKAGPVVIDLIIPDVNTAVPQGNSNTYLWKELSKLASLLLKLNAEDPVSPFLEQLVGQE
eukprot:TRINITY_DN1944_c0_g1_i1.p1 TRINITY_DN1944_c0_g1~~TRINITY_DN1944_c0_g1_i1.p1  ORF type:complete len:367 (+),score=70.87 TRINITY_DN1944_c0_g1_i1:208-1308(+)